MAANTQRSREVNRVYLISLLTNAVMLSLKLIVGILSGSLVMIADGMDSSLDAIANTIALMVTRIAANPPDEDHPYGYRRYETLAAMIVGGFLLLTATEIVKSSIERLVSGSQPEIGVANFAVMTLALVVNLTLFRLQRRAGERLRSEVLIASSEDKRSDIMVSITVLISLVTVTLGLGWVDAVAALVVVALIARNALRIIGRSAAILVDHAVLNPRDVRHVVADVPGVYDVTRVRSRGTEDDVYLDLAINVAPPTTVNDSAAIAEEIRARLRARFEGLTDIDVDFVPAVDQEPDYARIAHAEGAALGLGAHEVVAVEMESGLMLDMHVEVPADLTLDQAHDLVSRFEQRLTGMLPNVDYVITHIEPAYSLRPCGDRDERGHRLAQQALRIATHVFPDNQWHDMNVRAEADGTYSLSLHCRIDGSWSVERAHRLAEAVETRLRSELPGLGRITIHTEPT